MTVIILPQSAFLQVIRQLMGDMALQAGVLGRIGDAAGPAHAAVSVRPCPISLWQARTGSR